MRGQVPLLFLLVPPIPASHRESALCQRLEAQARTGWQAYFIKYTKGLGHFTGRRDNKRKMRVVFRYLKFLV